MSCSCDRRWTEPGTYTSSGAYISFCTCCGVYFFDHTDCTTHLVTAHQTQPPDESLPPPEFWSPYGPGIPDLEPPGGPIPGATPYTQTKMAKFIPWQPMRNKLKILRDAMIPAWIHRKLHPWL